MSAVLEANGDRQAFGVSSHLAETLEADSRHETPRHRRLRTA